MFYRFAQEENILLFVNCRPTCFPSLPLKGQRAAVLLVNGVLLLSFLLNTRNCFMEFPLIESSSLNYLYYTKTRLL
jgi:hypothetical protein